MGLVVDVEKLAWSLSLMWSPPPGFSSRVKRMCWGSPCSSTWRGGGGVQRFTAGQELPATCWAFVILQPSDKVSMIFHPVDFNKVPPPPPPDPSLFVPLGAGVRVFVFVAVGSPPVLHACGTEERVVGSSTDLGEIRNPTLVITSTNLRATSANSLGQPSKSMKPNYMLRHETLDNAL